MSLSDYKREAAQSREPQTIEHLKALQQALTGGIDAARLPQILVGLATTDGEVSRMLMAAIEVGGNRGPELRHQLLVLVVSLIGLDDDE